MIDIKKYIETRKEQRLVAEYNGRKPIHLNGEMSLNTALAIFEEAGRVEAVGAPNIIQECAKGGRRTVWDKLSGWSILERRLNKIQ